MVLTRFCMHQVTNVSTIERVFTNMGQVLLCNFVGKSQKKKRSRLRNQRCDVEIQTEETTFDVEGRMVAKLLPKSFSQYLVMSCQRNPLRQPQKVFRGHSTRTLEDMFRRQGLVGERAHELSNEEGTPKYAYMGSHERSYHWSIGQVLFNTLVIFIIAGMRCLVSDVFVWIFTWCFRSWLNYWIIFTPSCWFPKANMETSKMKLSEMTFLSLKIFRFHVTFPGVYIVASRYFLLFGHITSLTTSVYIIFAESHIILEILKKQNGGGWSSIILFFSGKRAMSGWV